VRVDLVSGSGLSLSLRSFDRGDDESPTCALASLNNVRKTSNVTGVNVTGVVRACECSKCRGLYRSLPRSGFLMGWFKLVGFRILVGKIPFLRDQFLDLRNLVGVSHIRSAPPAT